MGSISTRGPCETGSALSLNERHHLTHADHGSQRELDELGRTRGDSNEPKLDAELAAVAGLTGGVHAGRDGTELSDGLDQAWEQPWVGGGGDEEEGSDGTSLSTRRNADGNG
jgi:hypothetical protein